MKSELLFISSHNSVSIFSISLFNSMSVMLQRYIHCLLLHGNSVLLTGDGSWASSFCLCFSFSVSLGKPNYSLGGLLLCKSTPLYFMGVYYLFLAWEFEYLLSLSSVWAGCYSQDAQCVFREKEAMSRASSKCLVVGLSIAARTCRKVAQATPSCRVLGSCHKL